MIFIVALDPASVESAGQHGQLGYDHLTGVLECLLQNCFVAETSNWRIGEELKDAVKSLEETGIRKRVSAIIESLVTRGRFFQAIDDFRYDVPIANILVGQNNNPALDIIITENDPTNEGSVEVTKLAAFNQSNFARERNKRACSISFATGSLRAADLFHGYFRPLLMIGDSLTIIDKIIGKTFNDKFCESLVHWCEFLYDLDKPLGWTIHTEAGQCPALQKFIEERLSGGDVKIKVVSHSSDKLPHDRYFRCAGICIDIGRGIDLFDRDGFIRDVRLGLGDDNQFTKQYPHLA